MTSMPGTPFRDDPPPLTEGQAELRDRLEKHVRHLAEGIGERNVWKPAALQEAASYVGRQLEGAGYQVRRQTYQVQGVPCHNLEVQVPGEQRPLVVLGAHYDSVMGSPGANDNASSVAALIELARAFRDVKPRKTLRFVAFVNEEPPLFQTDRMGSMMYAARSRRRSEEVAAMIAMDGLGYYSDRARSQKYPPLLGSLYPSTGDFIGFVGDLRSRGLLRRALGLYREHTRFPSEGAVLPGFVPGVGWSDHWSFWRHGYPGIMVTDTLPLRDPAYHTPQDRPGRLDYDGMARVVEGLAHVLSDLAGYPVHSLPAGNDPASRRIGA